MSIIAKENRTTEPGDSSEEFLLAAVCFRFADEMNARNSEEMPAAITYLEEEGAIKKGKQEGKAYGDGKLAVWQVIYLLQVPTSFFSFTNTAVDKITSDFNAAWIMNAETIDISEEMS